MVLGFGFLVFAVLFCWCFVDFVASLFWWLLIVVLAAGLVLWVYNMLVLFGVYGVFCFGV